MSIVVTRSWMRCGGWNIAVMTVRIATHNGSGFEIARSVGKAGKSDSLIRKKPLGGDIGIGHTRWATHGGVSGGNAHPHIAAERVVIVHNGIIENHRQLRAGLERAGHLFSSDTDSEVLAHLFVEAFDAGLSPTEPQNLSLLPLRGPMLCGTCT